ncbi:MAG: PAS domain S-box protein, partial [Candidatus Methanoperedens sp.]|nr:PAS domain S-box protein [Candidatus Methanoperedens sp.]
MRIGLKLMVSFLIFTLLLTLLFYFIELQSQNENLNETSLENIKNINNTFHTLEESDTKILSSALEVVIHDPILKSIYLEKDREKLYNYGLPLFQNLKNKFGITHFYFILPNGSVFVRLHDEQIYGDIVTRVSFQKARDTKNLSSGIELGKTAFALRSVAPYYDNGELIGYMELGEEIDHFLKILKGNTNNEFAIIVDKEYLNREDWKSVRQVAGLRDNWNDSEKHLLISSTSEEEFASKCFVEDNLERIEKGENRFSQFQNKNKTYVCGGFSITDAGGRHIGAVLSLIDITDHVVIAQKSNYTLLGMAIILFVLTLTAGIIFSSSISKPITRLRDAANDIGKGNLNTKIYIESNDEIGQLAASFKKMTEELQKTTVSKKYVDNIIRSMFNTMVVATQEGTMERVNRATCDLLGYRAEELVGKNIDVIFADVNSHSKGSWLDALIKKGSISNMEKTYLAKDGRKIPMLFSGSIMHDESGKIQSIVCVAQDITERKQTEEMSRENERLVLASRAKSEFLATMSHELRTPLNSIIGFSELLKQKTYGELNEKQVRYVENVLTGGNNLLRLINDILDLSRMEAGKIDLEIEKVSVQAMIDESIDLIKEEASDHNIILKKEL